MLRFIFMFVIINLVSTFAKNASFDVPRDESQKACGVSSKRYELLTIKRKDFSKGTWPWMVAMFKEINKDYFCTGTMVSTVKVVTGYKLFLICFLFGIKNQYDPARTNYAKRSL